MKCIIFSLFVLFNILNSDCKLTKKTNIHSNVTVLKSSKITPKEMVTETYLVTEMSKAILNHTREDKTFLIDKKIFEDYLKDADLSLLRGHPDNSDLVDWVPSEQIKKDLPMYMSGFDKHNNPIWVLEYGKQNFYKYATGGVELKALFFKYNRYLAYNCLKSMALRSSKEYRVKQYVQIVDLEGLRPIDVLNPNVLQLHLKLLSDYRRWAEKYIGKLVLLNVNTISENLLTIGRYFIVRVLNKLEIYGTNKAFWVPQLLKIFAKDQIPEKYGGNKGFQPLYVLG